MNRLVAVLLLAMVLPASAPAQSARPAYREYQALLDEYCKRLGGEKGPLDTRFDYQQLFSDQQLYLSDRAPRLDRVRAELLAVDPATLATPDRVAWGLNLFDFLVIERITRHLLVTHHAWVAFSAVEQVGLREGPFFKVRVAEIGGHKYSLEEIERVFVYGDTSDASTPRRQAADPRLACALCTGKVGGPPLAPRAYRGDSLEAQLDDAARRVAALPRFFEILPSPHAYRLSHWFRERTPDFGQSDEDALRFIEKYGTAAQRRFLRDRQHIYPSGMSAVNGKLNQYDRPKPKPPGMEGS